MHGGYAFDSLKPEGQEVDHNEHCTWGDNREIEAGEDTALFDDSDGDRGIFAGSDLYNNENGDQDCGEDEEDYYAGVCPGVCVAAPLQG